MAPRKILSLASAPCDDLATSTPEEQKIVTCHIFFVLDKTTPPFSGLLGVQISADLLCPLGWRFQDGPPQILGLRYRVVSVVLMYSFKPSLQV